MEFVQANEYIRCYQKKKDYFIYEILYKPHDNHKNTELKHETKKETLLSQYENI